MPTLDDIQSLHTLGALKGHEGIPVFDRDGSGGSKIRRVPSALITGGFTHGWLFNYNNGSIAATTGHAATSFDVYTFDASDRVDKVQLICTKPFVGTGLSAATVVVGIQDEDIDGYIEAASVFAKGIFTNTGDVIDTELDLFGSYTTPTAADTLRITFDPDAANATLTAGQFVVLANIVNIDSYVDCLDPQ
jgi:hypothetical protein